MTKNKTNETDVNVYNFINTVSGETKREDSLCIVEIFKDISGFEPKMWGPSIIGFGSYHYKYNSGHEGDAPLAGFSPRKDSIVLYFASEFESREQLLEKLGKHKTGKVCVYVKKLEDIDISILKKLLKGSIAQIKKQYSG